MTAVGAGLRLDVSVRGSVTIIALHGKLDGDTAGQLERAVAELIQARQSVLLDLAATSYLSSAGLRVLLLIYRQAQDGDGRLAIARLTADVSEVMTATGFADFLVITDSIGAGLEALAG